MVETPRNNEETNATNPVGKTENFVSKHFVRLLVWLAVSGGALAIFGPWLLYVTGLTGETDANLRLHILYITGGTIAVLGLVETHRKNTVDHEKAKVEKENYKKTQAHQTSVLEEQQRQFNVTTNQERKKIKADKAKNEQDHIRQVHAERRSRYTTAVEQLSSDKASIRLGGVYTLVGLVDEWLSDEKTTSSPEERHKEGQVIINNLCAYIRSPLPLAERAEQLDKDYAKDLQNDFDGDIEKFDADKRAFARDKAALEEERQVRQSIIEEIHKRLQYIGTPGSWSKLDYDFSNAHFFYPIVFTNSCFDASSRFFGATFTQDADFSEAEFTDAHFSKAKFTDAHFSKAKFTDAHFLEAEFTGNAHFLEAEFTENAHFFEAKFTKDTDFSRAKFTKASFSRAKFTKASFSRAKFTGYAHFSKAEFTGNADFSWAEFTRNANFSKAEFTENAHFSWAEFTRNANFSGAKFTEDANFSGAKFTGYAHFSKAEFTEDANFSGAHFHSIANFSWAKFTKARFSRAKLTEDTDFSGVEFTGYANFFDAEFTGNADFSWAEFTGNADFSKAKFTKASFSRAKFTEDTDFSGVEFTGDANFSGATFEEKPIFERALGDKTYKARFSYKADPEDYNFKVSHNSRYKIETEEKEYNGAKFIIPKGTELFGPDEPSEQGNNDGN